MKRRNFLKLPLYAGFAAVFGVKLRAEPIALNITQTPTTFSAVEAAKAMDAVSGSIRSAVIDGVTYGPDEKDWPIVFFCDDLS